MSKKDVTVRDYFHITGEYINSAHQICNTNF